MLIKEHGWETEDFRQLVAYYSLQHMDLCPDCQQQMKDQREVECRACGRWYTRES